MKKRYTWLVLLVLFFSTTAFVIMRYQMRVKPVAFYPLLERKGALAKTEEWMTTKTRGRELIRYVRDNPRDVKNTLALATLYIQESRISGNPMYYDGAALNYINDVLRLQPENFDALVLKSMVLLSQHHFSDGLQAAEKAKTINPYNAFVYGLLVDASVELGQYKQAVDYSDKMVSIRPDLRSYSRISYLREIHGDYPGAIEAMTMAVEAGGHGDEATAWTRVQLARLYEATGDRERAAMQYTIAVTERPDYPAAVMGLGKMAMANGDQAKAKALYEQAISLSDDYTFREELAKWFYQNKDRTKGDELMEQIITGMKMDAERGSQEENIGHYSDRELAQAYLLTGNLEKARQHALAEYNRRPDNIDVNETLAWTCFVVGDKSKALKHIAAALKTGSNNPVLLCHAGLIYAGNGMQDKAIACLEQGLKNNPIIDPLLKQEAVNMIHQLNSKIL